MFFFVVLYKTRYCKYFAENVFKPIYRQNSHIKELETNQIIL